MTKIFQEGSKINKMYLCEQTPLVTLYESEYHNYG